MDKIKVLRQPSCDYLRVAGQVAPSELGFVSDAQYPPEMNRWWRPGWSGHLKLLRGGNHTFIAWAHKGHYAWPQPWSEHMHITRVDVCCDISITSHNGEQQRFKQEHRHLFTYRGSGNDVYKKHEVATLYVNSRESPITLRIYNKTACCERADKDTWSKNGWRGEDVWRIEYEYHNKPSRPVIPEDFDVPRDIETLWKDGLARVRMCTVPPRSCSQQNKAPTHPWWVALGKATRYTRRRGELTATGRTERERAMLSLARLIDKADPALLPAFAGYVAKMRRLHGDKLVPLGDTQEEEQHGETRKGKAPEALR